MFVPIDVKLSMAPHILITRTLCIYLTPYHFFGHSTCILSVRGSVPTLLIVHSIGNLHAIEWVFYGSPYLTCHSCVVACGETVSLPLSLRSCKYFVCVFSFVCSSVLLLSLLVYLAVRLLLFNASPSKKSAESGQYYFEFVPHTGLHSIE